MKSTFTAIFLGFCLTQLQAATFDVESFGQSLNGFSQKRQLAEYSINRQVFVTTIPTVTRRKDGGIFLSAQVFAGKSAKTNNVGVIEVAVASSGAPETMQLRLTVNGANITTALIERPANAATPTPESPASENLQPWKTATSSMVTNLFTDLNNQINKLDRKDKGSRDLYSRMRGRGNMLTHFPPALRHNLNLLLSSVR